MKAFKATSFLRMRWEYILMLGIVRRHCQNFYFFPLLTLLACLFLSVALPAPLGRLAS
jgi:hypothetical protein